MVLMLWQYLFNTDQNDQAGIQLIQATVTSEENYSWRWFGTNNASTEQSMRLRQEAEEQLAEASINAELVGVVMTQNFATATIRVNGQLGKVFSIGDELQPGVELLNVGTSRVVLRERGREVQLTMRKPDEMPVQLSNQLRANVSNSALLQDGFSAG